MAECEACVEIFKKLDEELREIERQDKLQRARRMMVIRTLAAVTTVAVAGCAAWLLW